jgi:hypothetical protein
MAFVFLFFNKSIKLSYGLLLNINLISLLLACFTSSNVSKFYVVFSSFHFIRFCVFASNLVEIDAYPQIVVRFYR